MGRRERAKKSTWPITTFLYCGGGGGGGKYNSLNSTFKIALKKGLDSEDADRRDSMALFRPRSFCHASEKLYKKLIFSLPNGKTQKGVISKHNHVRAKCCLKFPKYESISVRTPKKTEKMRSESPCKRN